MKGFLILNSCQCFDMCCYTNTHMNFAHVFSFSFFAPRSGNALAKLFSLKENVSQLATLLLSS